MHWQGTGRSGANLSRSAVMIIVKDRLSIGGIRQTDKSISFGQIMLQTQFVDGLMLPAVLVPLFCTCAASASQ